MSICNPASDGNPSVLQALYYTANRVGPMGRDELVHVCAPPSLGKSDAVRQTLGRWTELGLFRVDDSGVVCVDEKHELPSQGGVNWRDHLATQVRTLVFMPGNNVDLWQKEGNRAADFTRTLAWFLSQDAFSFSAGGHPEAEKLQARQLGSEKVFLNDTRWVGFKSWTSFLGFAWVDPQGRLQVDPAKGIADAVRSALGGGEKSIQTVRQYIADQIPVLDGGRYRIEVREKLREVPSRYATGTQVSTALSRALLHLEAVGLITLKAEADAEGLTLQVPEDRVVSLVVPGDGR